MSEVYSRRLREVIRASAEKCGIDLQEGVYVQLQVLPMKLRLK